MSVIPPRNTYFQKSLWLKILIIPLIVFGGFYTIPLSLLRLLRVIPQKHLSKIYCRMLYGSLRLLGYPKVVLRGRTELLGTNKPIVIVGNHQSNWDIVTYSRAFPSNTYVLAKKELFKIPLFGQFFYLSGNFLIDRSNKRAGSRTLQAMNKRIMDSGDSLFVFPEGTRNKDPNVVLQDFKIGAFKVAKETGADIVPVMSLVHPTGRPSPVILEVMDPISPANFENAEKLKRHTHELMKNRLAKFLSTGN